MATLEVYCKDCDCEYSLRGWSEENMGTMH